jgi:hypothetical protein
MLTPQSRQLAAETLVFFLSIQYPPLQTLTLSLQTLTLSFQSLTLSVYMLTLSTQTLLLSFCSGQVL